MLHIFAYLDKKPKVTLTFRVNTQFKANVSNNLSGRSLIGITCFFYDKMIQFMKIQISMYFTNLENKDHSSDDIESIYDDVVKDKYVKHI